MVLPAPATAAPLCCGLSEFLLVLVAVMGTVLAAMSNWEKLKSKLDEDKSKKGKKRKRSEISQAVER